MLTVKNLNKTYHLGKVEVKALSDIALNIEKGSMVALMGKSGSGKSTLLRQLSLIDTPDSGEILLNGKDVTKMMESERSTLRLEMLGYVFQEYALIPELSAQENVFLPALMLGKKGINHWKRAEEVLDVVGLGDRLHHLPKELSGGQQQRVAIARALVNDPQIIYADEATANLDSISAKTVMETLQHLNKELNVTVLFVSHDPDDAQYAQHVIRLADGKIA